MDHGIVNAKVLLHNVFRLHNFNFLPYVAMNKFGKICIVGSSDIFICRPIKTTKNGIQIRNNKRLVVLHSLQVS